jgi:hypothetical protein
MSERLIKELVAEYPQLYDELLLPPLPVSIIDIEELMLNPLAVSQLIKTINHVLIKLINYKSGDAQQLPIKTLLTNYSPTYIKIYFMFLNINCSVPLTPTQEHEIEKLLNNSALKIIGGLKIIYTQQLFNSELLNLEPLEYDEDELDYEDADITDVQRDKLNLIEPPVTICQTESYIPDIVQLAHILGDQFILSKSEKIISKFNYAQLQTFLLSLKTKNVDYPLEFVVEYTVDPKLPDRPKNLENVHSTIQKWSSLQDII